MITSLVFDVGLTSTRLLTSYLALIKLLVIFVIICQSTCGKNTNYISLLVAIYIYSAGTKIDTITLLNRLGLFVLYNVFLRKLGSITSSSITFIKEQVSNYKFIGMWNNFEYQENVSKKKIGDIV